MAPVREEVAAYVEKHNLEPRLSAMLSELVQARPDNVASWMSGYLAAAGSADGAGRAPGAPPAAPSADAAKLEPQRSLMKQVVEVCARAQQTAFAHVTLSGHFVTEATKPEFGQYQNNAALSLFGRLKGTPSAPSSPRAVALALADAMRAAADELCAGLIDKLEVAGAGFINIWIARTWIEARVLDAAIVGMRPPAVVACRALVDFSSPNVAKEMHVGHLRSTIIGDTICRVLEFTGHETMRVNHVGDWGTQFGMLIAHMRREHPDFLSAPPPISDLQQFYKAAKVRFDEDASFKAEAHKNVVALQAGDPDCHKAWTLICEASREEFSKVYRRLGIELDEVGESFYNPFIPAVVSTLERYGQVVTEGGAKVIFPPQSKHAIPLIVVKSDGGFNYDSTDLAAVWYRLCELKAEWVIYVVDAGQGSHFDLVFDAAANAGWTAEGTRLQHVQFGLVCGEDGKRFRTRSGEVVRLVDLLDEAKARMLATFKERQAAAQSGGAVVSDLAAAGAASADGDEGEGGSFAFGAPHMADEEMERAAEALGYAAVKYMDLKSNRTSNYIFNYERMLATNGNTAVYLLYAHARLCSIIDKSGADMAALKAARTPIVLEHPAEQAVGLAVAQFAEKVEDVLRELQPHVLCEYLYDTCVKLNVFVRECRVINVPETPSRLMLCAAGIATMRKCFDLLGMAWLERI
ncbi:hypothetical protein KFE25_003405 [Diacronema lutheri]|uniref:arginine--tRNA ligase n=1 Tax=Diacronema lutheri TaxID=2081491 RepID=A0A8J5XMA7_DIALT|nr:hypothetical protein KFE25_003405 [Diacronema lutheri]